MDLQKEKIRKENKEIEEMIAKKDQQMHMADMRLRELERFISYNSKPKFPLVDENGETEIGDNISITTKSLKSYKTANSKDPRKNIRVRKSARGIQKKISDKLEIDIDHLPIPQYVYSY